MLTRMKREVVDIYSDAPNGAVLRHPGRKFPGLLIQGDTLSGLVKSLDRVQRSAHQLKPEAQEELEDVHQQLREALAHYKSVLIAHGLPLPFVNQQKD